MYSDDTADAYNGLLTEFNNHLQATQKNLMQSWLHPLEYAFNSLNHLSSMTNRAAEQLFQNHTDVINALGWAPSRYQAPESDPHVTTGKQREITHQVAVITGGTGGIGTEICKRLFMDGHHVIATHIVNESDQAREWQSAHKEGGIDIDIIECDVTDYQACRKMAGKLIRKYKRIDILVNCAGITRDSTLRKMDVDHWHAVLDTNLDSVFNVTRNLVDNMTARKFGRIINISSVNGQKGQFGQTNYATAKAGIIGFSKALALELADQGITVNTICPGYVETTMVEAIPDDIKNSIIAKIPVGRLANPAEIASVVSFLSDEKSAYITGSEISVNGGLFTGIA